MTKDEKNRKIAEWLEPRPTWDRNCRGRSPIGAWERRRLREWRDGAARGYWNDQPCDFFTDEAANALVLEKLPAAQVRYHPISNLWSCDQEWTSNNYREQAHRDRKTAICEAAIKLMDTPHASSQTPKEQA